MLAAAAEQVGTAVMAMVVLAAAERAAWATKDFRTPHLGQRIQGVVAAAEIKAQPLRQVEVAW